MSSSGEIKQLYEQLSKEWQAKTKDLKKIGGIIDELKVRLMAGDFTSVVDVAISLPDMKQERVAFATSGAFMPTDQTEYGAQTSLMVMQRETVELAALYAIALKDSKLTFPYFERAMQQLRVYYDLDSINKVCGESGRKNMMEGLNLMALLAKHKLSEFHMALERIPVELTSSNPYIRFPVNLEQLLMEGTYNKIFLLKSNLPSPDYAYFMDILIDTVRDEIGQCMAVSYLRLSATEAARQLFFTGDNSAAQMKRFAEARGWKSDGGHLVFKDPSLAKHEDKFVPSVQLARSDIFYAKQLEMIV